ncbi:salt tolerance down-regulator-domain-containing protein [Calycina marina]|uniref:Stress response protein NST1 n=1 Tax=Calycina marina TaxID=1763456 RepID=A0A9P7YW55_9HELO|nr:salt tolerance down-regulator-domain-containing protein [Calycina marina]
MPVNQRQQTAKSKAPVQVPSSPSTIPTVQIKNKDGSKFINVPSATKTHSADMAQTSTRPNGNAPTGANGSAPTVNRKKQKRREKQAAKLAAEGILPNQAQPSKQVPDLAARVLGMSLDEQHGQNGQFDEAEGEEEMGYYSEDDPAYEGLYGQFSPPNGYTEPAGKKSKKKKNNKAKKNQLPDPPSNHSQPRTNGLAHPTIHNYPPSSLPPLGTNMPRGPGISRERIWNTSSNEERERIKEFWLSLGEEDRKSLVKVEKDAVLKKMKEQQKHSCTCTVCGRKRIAIEEELEVLYDAYYEELEQYANNQGDGVPPMMPPPRRYGAMSGLHPPNCLPLSNCPAPQPSRGRIVKQDEQIEEDEDDEDYEDSEQEEDDEDEDDYDSNEEPEPEEIPRSSHAADFFNFGNSLTVKGGILTVADDLLKNDGKKFIEMMEQLAERRMAREEDAEAQKQQAYANYSHPPNGMHSHSHGYHNQPHNHSHGHSHSHHPHNHNHPHSHPHPHPHPPPQAPPLQDDEEYDDEEEEDDEEYSSQDEDYDDDEMPDTMTEEQRMEEGRRMFQIFAARMFEQRVLTAYKEKVARERQEQLLQEMEDEKQADSQKKAKKAKDAQKKKEKLAQKKQALAEEKAQKEAVKAAEEAALRAAEEQKLQEQRSKAEEKRKKKEAQKKAEEEERLKKEAEKQRRAQEQKDRQAEAERKQREAKEKEKLQKEQARLKEKEAKEAKERELKERKDKQDIEKREKEAKAQQLREQQAAQQAAQKSAALATQAVKRAPVPIPVNLLPQSVAAPSPHIPIATPALPKAPTPGRLRTVSQQGSSNSGPSVPQTPQTVGISQNVSPVPSAPLQGSPVPIGTKTQPFPFLHEPQAKSPIHSALKGQGPPGMLPTTFSGLPNMNMNMGYPPPPGLPMNMPPGFGGRLPHEFMYPQQQSMSASFRPPMSGPNGMPMHPSMLQGGRGFPPPQPPPGFPGSPNLSNVNPIGTSFAKDSTFGHSRQASASFENPLATQPPAQPIARPGPINRPSSIVHGRKSGETANEPEETDAHLGSSALLDGSDEQIPAAGARRQSAAPRHNFAPGNPFGMDSPGAFPSPNASFNTWGGPQIPFGSSSLPGSSFTGGWLPSTSTSFGAVGGSSAIRAGQPRSVTVRQLACRACNNLEASSPDGFVDIKAIQEEIAALKQPSDLSISETELIDICDTEGNAINGGGTFETRNENDGRQFIRHELDNPKARRPLGTPGEIGSPIVGVPSRFFS